MSSLDGVRLSASLKLALQDLGHPPASQIPFLDALRTAAILLVINHHVVGAYATANGQNAYSRLIFVRNGWIGVDLFFVLSGFFIGGQLWKELARTGRVNVGQFILRRGFRIWPLYFFTYFCVLLWMGKSAASHQYGWSDVVFLSNYVNHGIVAGSWSLCTEEQFYILAPILLFIFARKNVLSFQKWLWPILLLPLANRIVVWLVLTGHLLQDSVETFSFVYYRFHTHSDGLVMGLIISNLWVAKRRGGRWLALVLVPLGLAFLAMCQHLQHHLLIFIGLALFFGSLVWFGLHWRFRVFESHLFYWGSRLSFGMYLNHSYLAPWVLNNAMPIFGKHAIVAELFGAVSLSVLSALLSVVTFCIVEYPFLEWRSRLLESRSKTISLMVVSAVDSNKPELTGAGVSRRESHNP